MLPSPRLARRRAGTSSGADTRPASSGPAERGGGVIACGACGQPVTSTAARIDRAGSHAHTFANPHGIVFHIGCFDRAPGCTTASAPETLFSWFPGHAWQVAACRGCSAHLGWLFSGPDRFHGLILDRLVEAGEPH